MIRKIYDENPFIQYFVNHFAEYCDQFTLLFSRRYKKVLTFCIKHDKLSLSLCDESSFV